MDPETDLHEVLERHIWYCENCGNLSGGMGGYTLVIGQCPDCQHERSGSCNCVVERPLNLSKDIKCQKARCVKYEPKDPPENLLTYSSGHKTDVFSISGQAAAATDNRKLEFQM